MGRRHPEREPETFLTYKGPGGVNKHRPVFQGDPSNTDPNITDEQRVQAIINLMDNTPPMREKRGIRRGR